MSGNMDEPLWDFMNDRLKCEGQSYEIFFSNDNYEQLYEWQLWTTAVS